MADDTLPSILILGGVLGGGYLLLSNLNKPSLSMTMMQPNPKSRKVMTSFMPPIVAGSSLNFDAFGVKKLFPTKPGGSEWYLNMSGPSDSKFNISYGTGSNFPSTKKTEGGVPFFNTTGSRITYASGQAPGRSVRLDNYPDGGKWSNNTSYSWKNNPGYLYTSKGIRSGEMTAYVRVHGSLGTHQACAFKTNGRDQDAIRSEIETVYATNTHTTVVANWNYSHFPYVAVPNVMNYGSDRLTPERWVGLKHVHMVAPKGSTGHCQLYADTSPFMANGRPANNWKLRGEWIDNGPPTGYSPRTACNWACHKDTLRIDGFQSVDFTYLSNREIAF